MFKKLLLISILFVLSIGMVSASDNVTGDISSTNDVGEDIGMSVSDDDSLQSTIKVSGNTFNDIQNSIYNAKENDVIQLSGTYSGSGNSIYVDKTLTIQGNSNKATLDAKGLSSIISTSYDIKLTLKNIVFKNSDGYAVVSLSDTIVNNCNFDSNEYGISCADSSESSILTVKNSVFNNNDGAAIDAQVKTLTVEKSTFTNNKDSAINVNSFDSTTVSVKDSTFSENSAETGAALYLFLKKGTATVNNCIFNNNKASNSGGAIFLFADETFNLNILGSTFNGNTATKSASALSLDDTNANIKNNIFIGNNAKDEIISSVGYIGQRTILDNNFIKSDVNVDDKLAIEFLSVPEYYGDVFQVKFTKDGNPLSNKKLTLLAFKQGTYYSALFNVVTDSEGIAKIAFSSSDITDVNGVWDIQVIADEGNSKLVSSKNNLNVKQLQATISSKDLSTTYASGKVFSFNINNKITNQIAGNVKVYITIYKNNFYLKNQILSSKNGVVNVKISNLASANYEFYIDSYDTNQNFKLTKASFKVKINKAPTKVSAPKVTNKFKKSKYFKVSVKAYNKPVNKLKVKVKVFTGKKSKTYTITTNKKGVAQLNTKTLSKGTHKVVISSGNNNYKISAKSTIKIK